MTTVRGPGSPTRALASTVTRSAIWPGCCHGTGLPWNWCESRREAHPTTRPAHRLAPDGAHACLASRGQALCILRFLHKLIGGRLIMTSAQDELAAIADRIARTRLSDAAREKARHELETLRRLPPMSAAATVVRDYL